jgi:hypothetical protein
VCLMCCIAKLQFLNRCTIWVYMHVANIMPWLRLDQFCLRTLTWAQREFIIH